MYSLSPVPVPVEGNAVPAPCSTSWRGSGKVLVIEDDVAIKIVLSRALARLGFTTAIAGDGAEALALFSGDPGQFALVLLDFKLPGMPSEDILREIRARRPDLPVVLTSGYDREEAMRRSNGMDVASFLHKPFTVESLATEMRNVLGP